MCCCIFCFGACPRSRLTRCGHPAHVRCLAEYLRENNQMECARCHARYRCIDVSKITSDLKDLYCQARIEVLKRKTYEILWEDMLPEDLDHASTLDYED